LSSFEISSDNNMHGQIFIGDDFDRPVKKERGRRRHRTNQQKTQDAAATETTNGPTNLLLSLLLRVNGREFGGYFLGSYLCFRDALSVARTCKAAHECMMQTQSFISSYIIHVLDQFKQSASMVEPLSMDQFLEWTNHQMLVHEPMLDEYNHIRQLPLMQTSDILRSFMHYRSMSQLVKSVTAHKQVPGRWIRSSVETGGRFDMRKEFEVLSSGNEQGVDKMSVDGEKPVPMDGERWTWDLSFLVNHLSLAVQVCELGHKQCKPSYRSLVDLWLERAGPIPAIPTKTVQKTLQRKIRAAAWPQALAPILVSWALRRGCPIGTWKPGTWMHCVLKLLLHTVDLDGSCWKSYLQDPRYLYFYRPLYFDRERITSRSGLDIWMLINDMAHPGFFPYCRIDTNLNEKDDDDDDKWRASEMVIPFPG
jgi:hypothetical protein